MSRSFGNKIKDLRIQRGMTLEEVAEKVGSKKAYIWQLENKDKARPSAKLLIDLSTALGVAPDYLIDDEAEVPSEEDMMEGFLRVARGKGMSNEEIKKLLDIADSLARNAPTKSSE